MFLLEFLPNDWQSGWLAEIVMIGAVVGALAVVGKTVVVPTFRSVRRVVTAIETAVSRLDSVPEHDGRLDVIEQAVCAIKQALEPTNGDRRSISDRLDSVKHQTIRNSDDIQALKIEVANLIGETAP
jgi:hypothetical protein